MKFEHLANLFMNWGWIVEPADYEGFKNYLSTMLKRRHVVVIWNGPLIEAVMTYIITDDYHKFLGKPIWSTPEDEPYGLQVYIDKIVCRRFTRELWRKIRDFMEDNFQGQEEAVYHRPFDNRTIIIKRRNKNVNLSVAEV